MQTTDKATTPRHTAAPPHRDAPARRNTLRRASACILLATVLAIAVGCRREADRAYTQRMQSLQQMDDSVKSLAPSAQTTVARLMAGATDSLDYYEYFLRQAYIYWLSDRPERATPCLDRLAAYATANGAQAATQPYTDTRMRRMCALLAGTYSCRAALLHNFHQATDSTIRLYAQAYRLLHAAGEPKLMPKLCANMADAYIQDNNLAEAARWYRRALFLTDSLRMPPSENTTLYMGLGQIYVSLHDYDQARLCYERTERNFARMTPSMQAYYLNNLGNFYYYQQQYARALAVFRRLERHLAECGMQNNFDMYLCRINMADTYLNLDSTRQAARYLDQVEPFFRRTGDPTAVYYCNTIRIGIAAQRGDNAEVERIERLAPASADVPANMASVRNGYLRRHYERTGDYRRAYRLLLDMTAYNDSLEQSRENMRSAEIMARLANDTIRLHNDLAIEHKNATIERTRATLTAAVGVAAVLALLLTAWIMYARRKRTEARMDIMRLKMQCVRNRISPHFMFNVLNNRILSTQGREADELEAMARLIRTNLDMSGKPCVPLSDEIDFVRQYIDVERHLLGDGFHFSLNIGNGVHPERVSIPAMFVQILAENAVVHGLKGREGLKRLDISIGREAGATTISVCDNGPGFATAALQKKTGLGIIAQTIAAANAYNKHKMRFAISNITDNSGLVRGCKATLLIPDGITVR